MSTSNDTREALAAALPEIDHAAAVKQAYAHPALRAPQGTLGSIAFAKGAEWYRSIALAEQPAAPQQHTVFARMEDGGFAEAEAKGRIEEVLGVELLGLSFDYYDSSFEIYPMSETGDVAPTKEQHDAILALGCLRYWINFPDGTERYGLGVRKASSSNRWDSYNRSAACSRSEIAAAIARDREARSAQTEAGASVAGPEARPNQQSDSCAAPQGVQAEGLAAELDAARDALPMVGEPESVTCCIDAPHLRMLLDAATALAEHLGLVLDRIDADLAAPPSPPAVQPGSFQARVEPWLLACFGAQIAADTQERSHRFIEEALELVQACGCTASEAHQLVDYVFGRPTGERCQEVGGVMVTLAALCRAHGLDMHEAGEAELARVWTKVDQIRAKQAAKPKHSPLPIAQSAVQPDPAVSPDVQELVAVLARMERAFDWFAGRSGFTQSERLKGLEHCARVRIEAYAAHDAVRAALSKYGSKQ